MTRQPDFTGVRVKIERAKHHFRDLQARYERYQEVERYRVAQGLHVAVVFERPERLDESLGYSP